MNKFFFGLTLLCLSAAGSAALAQDGMGNDDMDKGAMKMEKPAGGDMANKSMDKDPMHGEMMRDGAMNKDSTKKKTQAKSLSKERMDDKMEKGAMQRMQ